MTRSLSYAVFGIQNAFISAACIEDFSIAHVARNPRYGDRETVKVHYSLRSNENIAGIEALMASIETTYGLEVIASGSYGDGLFIVWTRAAE